MNTKISEAEHKIPDISSLMTTTAFNTNIGEVKNKIPHYVKYITTEESSKLTAENFALKLKQANLQSKVGFANETISLNKKYLK